MRKNKILAIIILLAGVSVSAYLLFYKRGADASEITIKGSERSDAIFTNSATGEKINIGDPSYNITDEVAKDYTKKIVLMNEGGTGDVKNVQLPTSGDFESIVKSYLAQEIQYKEYTESDIRTSAADTKDARIGYLKMVKQAQEKTVGALKTNFTYATALLISKKQSVELQNHINYSEQFITSLLEIEVPKSAKQFHIDLLNVYKKRSALGTILLENNEDPLKSVVVLQEIENLNNKELSLFSSFKSIIEL